MANQITGGCLCGQVRYELQSEPKVQLACHCRNCQRHTGSAFSVCCITKRENFTLQGAPKSYSDKGNSGNGINRLFCPDCGSTLFFELTEQPGSIAICAGTLDDVSAFKPAINLWTDSKQDWVTIDPQCRNFPGEAG